MFVGFYVLSNGSQPDFFTPEFPRGGLAALFSMEVTQLNGGATLLIDIQHKNSEDTSWSTLGTFTGITAAGTHTKDVSGIKEQMRLRFYFQTGDSAGDWFYVVPSSPAWRPY